MSTPVTRKKHPTQQNISLVREADIKMLTLQSKILVHHIQTICFHHEKELLKQFSLQQRNCSDPFNIHPNKQRTK